MAAEDLIPVRVEGLKEPVFFPRTMSQEQIQAAIERDVLPSIQAQASPPAGGGGLGSYGPANNPWVQVNQAAAAGQPPAGAPTLGQAATDAAATATRYVPSMLASPAPLIAGPVAAGSEAAAQGIEMLGGSRQEFDPTAVGVAAAVPPAMKLTTKGAQFVAGKLPGAAATLHQMAKEQLEHLGSIFGPARASADLYAIVDKESPTIAITNLKAATSKLLTKEQMAAAGLKMPGPVGVGEELAQRSLPTGELPFQEIRENLIRIGDMIRQTRAQGGREHGAWKLAYKGLMDDLEAAATSGSTQVAETLKQANAAARREYVSEEIADIFTKGGLTSRPDIGPDAFQVNFGRIADALRKGKHAEDIRATLKPEEYEGLLARVSELAKMTPALPALKKQSVGSSIVNPQIAKGGAIGTLAGYAFGQNPLVTGAVGVMVGTTGVDVLTRLMMSDPGRQLLSHFLSQSGGVVTQKMLSMLGLAAAQLPEVKGVTAQLGSLGRDYMMGTK